MRLRRIEAGRFGNLTDASLGPLGDGLTVVLGPNEAGKSSFTALVRYLLYGFPTKKSAADRPYLSPAGPREGRLVFESAEGEWVIERVSGPKGGPSSVRALRGPQRPGLIDELTSGVSKQAFKVVFGFGLAEMDAIERLRGTDDDIIARLYAVVAGLTVSPQEVRAIIDAEADALYKPRGTRPLINSLAADARDLRRRISELEHAGEEVAADRARLVALATELDAANEALEEASTHHRMLIEEHRTLSELQETVGAAESELLTLRRVVRDAQAAVERAVVDDAALAAAADISGLAEELSAIRQRTETARELEERIAALRAEREARLAEAGVEAQAAAAIDLSPETRAGVERWRDELLSTAQRAKDAAEKRDEQAESAKVAADEAARESSTPAPAAGGRGGAVAWAALAAGIVLAAAGLYFGQWLAALAGVLLAGFAATQARRGGAIRTGPDTQRLADRAADLAASAEKAALSATRAAEHSQAARAEWRAWLEERGLGGFSEPAAVVRVLELLSEARRLEAECAHAAERLERERVAISAFVERVGLCAASLEMASPADVREAQTAVERMKGRLDTARSAAQEAAQARADAEAAAAAVTDAETRQAHATSRAQEIIERLGVEGGLAELSAAVEQAGLAEAEARERWGALKSEHASLQTRIGEREREGTMGTLRLELASASERIAQHTERYAALALASRLLQRAQERYEKERQPEVVREAERLFSTITGGRYGRLTVPIGDSAIEVFDASARAKETGILSDGTAGQLYLALRLALIGQLGETGAALPVLMDDVFATFDPQRKAGAAEAVAELARTRQVVVFTCHPETAELLGGAEPGLASLSLDRC